MKLKPNKKFEIEFVSANKITKKAHALVLLLFDIDGIITNESYLDDFLDLGGTDLTNEELENEHIKMVEKIRYAYGVLVPEILEGELRIWKIARIIEQRQKEKEKGKKN